MTSGNDPAAIVLSGYVGGLGPIRSLGERGVRVVLGAITPKDPARLSRFVSETLPLPDPALDEIGFVVSLEMAAGRHPGAVLIPADDETLIAVSRNKDRLAERFRVACGDWDAVRVFIDKQYTYQLAAAAGVPVPHTLVPSSIEEVDGYAARASYPVLVKPSQSHLYARRFGRKLTEVEDANGLRAAYAAAADAGLDVMLQERIPGADSQGTNYNCYMWDGVPLVEFTARKVRLQPSAYGRPSSVVSRWIPELVEPGRAVLRSAAYSGFANVEFKQDLRDGAHKLMEVNARINFSSLLAARSGVDFAWLMYRHAAFGEVPSGLRQRTGLYWIDGGRDLISGARAVLGRRSPLRSLVEPFARRHIWAAFDRRDPYPAIARYVGAAQRTVDRMLHDPERPAIDAASPHR